MRDLGTMLAHMLGADPASTGDRIATMVNAMVFAEDLTSALKTRRTRLRATGVPVEVMLCGPLAVEKGDRYDGRLRSRGIQDALRANLDDRAAPAKLLFAEIFIPGHPSLKIEVCAEGDLYAAVIDKHGQETVVESGFVSDYSTAGTFLGCVLSPMVPTLQAVPTADEEDEQ